MRPEYLTLINTVLLMFMGAFTYYTKKSVSEVHLSVNSRLDELLRVTRLASHAEGVKEEKDRKDRMDRIDKASQ